MKKNVILGSIVLVLLLSQIGTFIWNRTLRDKLHIAEQNVTVALDSIRTLKDTNGKLYAEKKSYITTVKELKDLNKEMHENIQSLERKMRRLLISGANIGIKTRDTIIQKNIINYTLDSLVNQG